MNRSEFKELLDFFKVFAEPERFKIILLLSKGRFCVCELTKKLKLPQNLISYHLKTLNDFNLIYLRKKGRKNYYFVNKKELNKRLKLIKKLLS